MKKTSSLFRSGKNHKLKKNTTRTMVFTDGSPQKDGMSGFGVYLVKANQEIEYSQFLGSDPMVFQAEVLAILI